MPAVAQVRGSWSPLPLTTKLLVCPQETSPFLHSPATFLHTHNPFSTTSHAKNTTRGKSITYCGWGSLAGVFGRCGQSPKGAQGTESKAQEDLLGTALLVVGLTLSVDAFLCKSPFPPTVWMHGVLFHLRQHLHKMEPLHKAGCDERCSTLPPQVYLHYLIPCQRNASWAWHICSRRLIF